jgi:hypothetical protein
MAYWKVLSDKFPYLCLRALLEPGTGVARLAGSQGE